MTELSCEEEVNADETISTMKRKPMKMRYDTAKNVLLRLTVREKLGVNRNRGDACIGKNQLTSASLGLLNRPTGLKGGALSGLGLQWEGAHKVLQSVLVSKELVSVKAVGGGE
jgi:hypothetical protein